MKYNKSIIPFIAILTIFLSCTKNGKLNTDKQNELNKKMVKAVVEDDFKLVKELIKQGADPNYKFVNPYNKTLLFWAINHNFDLAEFLIKHGADVNAKNVDNETPIFLVKQKKAAQLLIDNGAIINNIQNKNKLTPLSKACYLNKVNIVITLLNNGVEPDDSTLPLHKATKRNNIKIVKLLIQNKADINRQDKYGDTPMHIIAFNEYITLAHIFIKNNADITIKNCYGNTPLDTARYREKYKVLKIFRESIKKKSKDTN